MIPLLDVSNGKIVPSVHTYNIPWLKRIIENFPEEYLQVYSYIFYKTCPDGTLNPYVRLEEEAREDVILADLKPTFWVEDLMILDTIERCKAMYETPVLRAFVGAKKMIDKMARYLSEQEITEGKEGNAATIRGIMKELPDHWAAYRKWEEELNKEQAKVRGNARIRYDQLPGYKDSKAEQE